MGFIRGLLTNLGGMQDDEDQTRPPRQSQFNPQQYGYEAAAAQGLPTQGGLLTQQMPAPTPFNPNAAQPTLPQVAEAQTPPAPVENPSHRHREGLLGRASHWLGADRLPAEAAALLTPAQQAEVRPKGLIDAVGGYLLTGKTAQERALGRTQQVLSLTEAKRQKDEAERQRRQFETIQGVAERMRQAGASEEDILAYTARRTAAAGLPQGGEMALANSQTREREFAPPRETWTLGSALVDGKPQQIWRSNTGRIESVDRQDLSGRNIQPVPVVPSFSPLSGGTTESGEIPLVNTRTGQVIGSGVQRDEPGARKSPEEIRIINNERSLAYDDAQLSLSGLVDEDGNFKEPPGSWDRLVTRSDWTNWFASNYGQAYLNNVRKLIRSWVVLIEGKRMSDADAAVNEAMRSFRPGDKSLVVENKKSTLESMAASIRALGDRANVTQPAAPAAPAGRTQTVTINGRTFEIPR